jgi:lipopolysaccharide export system permease protein
VPPGAAARTPEAVVPRPVIPPPIGTPATTVAPPPASVPPPSAGIVNATPIPPDANSINVELSDAKIRLDDARHWQNRYGVEIQKKFSLAFACIVFVLVGAPIALRFPRGGVGLVMGVGFAVFAVYYVGLIGGESLANNNIISPFWAMWIDNIVFLIVGLAFVSRMGHERVTSRGGNFGEMMDAARAWFARRRAAQVSDALEAKA